MTELLMDLNISRQKFEAALLECNRVTAREVLTYPYPDLSTEQLLEELVVPVLERIGVGWETGQYSLSQVYMSGKICEELINNLLPPSEQTAVDHPKIAIAVLEDRHLLGLRIVSSFMHSSGFNLTSYGAIKLDDLVNQVKKDNVRILLLSVLMLPSALKVKDLINQLKEEGVNIKIIVGGAPFRSDSELWKEVQADACGKKPSDAVTLTKQMMEQIS